MPIRKAPKLSPEEQEARQVRFNEWEKEKRGKEKNSEKQKRFRESMKAAGMKQVLLWAFPCPAEVRESMEAAGFRQAVAWEKPDNVHPKNEPKTTVKIAVKISEPMIDVASKSPEVKAALSHAMGGFLMELEKSGISKEEQAAYYAAFQGLLKPMGDPWGH